MVAMVKTGQRDRRLELLELRQRRDNANAPVEEWVPIATVWAAKTDVSDGERIRAQEVGASITTRFVVAWSAAAAGMTRKNRLREGAAEYEISGKKEIGRKQGIEFTASARVE